MSILIDENTTFIIQGITGREAVNMTRECLASLCHAERPRGSLVAQGIVAKASGVGRTPGRGAFALTLAPKLRVAQTAASLARSTVCPSPDSFAALGYLPKRAWSALRMTAEVPCQF